MIGESGYRLEVAAFAPSPAISGTCFVRGRDPDRDRVGSPIALTYLGGRREHGPTRCHGQRDNRLSLDLAAPSAPGPRIIR